jgi:ferrous iron transport protein A
MDRLPLAGLNEGDQGKVTSIIAGGQATKRLYEMGFNTGAKIKVIKNDRGPIIVTLGSNKIALGRGLAEKMLVSKE